MKKGELKELKKKYSVVIHGIKWTKIQISAEAIEYKKRLYNAELELERKDAELLAAKKEINKLKAPERERSLTKVYAAYSVF